MSTTVGRNPFARGEYLRECVANTELHYACHWCGQAPKRLYCYTWQEDTSRSKQWYDSKMFCNLTCHDTYYG